MSVSVFLMNKSKDFKLFDCEVDNLRIYEIHANVSYRWRLLFTFLKSPNITIGRYLDEVVVPSGNNDLSIFKDCKVRSLEKNDKGIYTVIITSTDVNITYMYDVNFKDGKQMILIDDAMTVGDTYGDISKFTYEEFKTRLVTCRL